MFNIHSNTPVELIYKKGTPDERIVVRFPKGLSQSAEFNKNDKYLEAAMKTMGIPIPVNQRKEYPELLNDKNRQAIYLEDKSFGKAFYEVHFLTMDPDVFTWKKA